MWVFLGHKIIFALIDLFFRREPIVLLKLSSPSHLEDRFASLVAEIEGFFVSCGQT